MGLLLAWRALLYLLLLTNASFAKLEGSGVRVKKSSSVQIDVYHARGPGSHLALESPLSLSDLLLLDEERVKSLANRVIAKQRKSPRASGGDHDDVPVRPKSDRIPLNPGLSIGTGNYYVKLGLGSPPKYFSMVLDTGSSLSWLQCEPCMLYCHPQIDTLFDPSASKTYKSLSCSTSECSSLKASTLNDPSCGSASKCIYTASYGDQSFSRGYLSQDLLTLSPSQTLPSFVFGCGQENLGLFGRSAGLVGLARDRLSMLAQLSPKYGYAFSYCLPTSTSPASSAGGFLSVGSISPSSSSYKFTTMLSDSQNPSLYFLRLASIVVGGSPLRLSASQFQVPTIIDSGTVITRLSSSVYSALSQAFANIMLSKKYTQAPAYSILDTCFTGSLKTLSSGAPEIRLIFQGGADLTLPASNVLVEADDGVACLAFASSSSGSGAQIAVIGNHQQQTFDIAYDVSGSRIGFASGGCR